MHHTDLGPSIPRRGNDFVRRLGERVLRWCDFELDGELPDIPRAVLVGAPHTSNWDGVIGLSAILSMRLNLVIVAKQELFRGPLGWFLRLLNIMPVDRSINSDVVQQIVAQFRLREQFWFGLTPEGTRKSAKYWKSGFYHIARRADVPIVPVVLDYGRRQVRLLEPVTAGEDYETTLQELLSRYRGVRPRRPERLSLPLREQ